MPACSTSTTRASLRFCAGRSACRCAAERCRARPLDRIKLLLIVLLVVGVVGLVGVTLYRYGTQSWRFRIDSSDNIELLGNHNVTRAQVLEVMGGDIDRNIFFVSLAERKKQLEDIPWVESAAVMRLYPNRLRIELHERTPVAFVAVNSHIAFIDAHGVIMDMPPGAQTSLFVPRDRRHERQRAAVHARRAHEDLRRADQATRLHRRALLARA